jgi:hypothetical protein
VLLCLFSLSCNKITAKPYLAGNKEPLIYAAITFVLVGSMVAAGSCWYFSEKEQQSVPGQCESKSKHYLMDALGIAALPACGTAALVWWILGKYTVDGYKKFIEDTNKDVLLELSTKLTNGTEQMDSLNEEQMRAYLRMFPAKSGASLIEAEHFLKASNEKALEKVKRALTTLRFAKVPEVEIKKIADETAQLSDVIIDALRIIEKEDDYLLQGQRYQEFRKQEYEKEDRNAERESTLTNNLIKWILATEMVRYFFSRGN